MGVLCTAVFRSLNSFSIVCRSFPSICQIIESEPSGWGEPPPVVDQNTLDLVPAVQRGALERWNLEEQERYKGHCDTG